jgi:hypothetical protein
LLRNERSGRMKNEELKKDLSENFNLNDDSYEITRKPTYNMNMKRNELSTIHLILPKPDIDNIFN